MILIKGDVEKGKELLVNNKNNIANSKDQLMVYHMPLSYFKDVDYDLLAIYISKDCIEHIRNINEYVFTKWNNYLTEMQQLHDADELLKLQDLTKTKMLPEIDEFIGGCDITIKTIDSELDRMK